MPFPCSASSHPAPWKVAEVPQSGVCHGCEERKSLPALPSSAKLNISPSVGTFHLLLSILGPLVLQGNPASPFLSFPPGKMPLAVIYSGYCWSAAENQSNHLLLAHWNKVTSVRNTWSYRLWASLAENSLIFSLPGFGSGSRQCGCFVMLFYPGRT